jgi:anti-anti-sigma factor
MAIAASAHQAGTFEPRVSSDRTTLTFLMRGRLDANTTGKLWRDAQHLFEHSNPIRAMIDASEVSYCDGAGVAFLVTLRQYQTQTGGQVTIHGLQEEFRRWTDLTRPSARTSLRAALGC